MLLDVSENKSQTDEVIFKLLKSNFGKTKEFWSYLQGISTLIN
jgi:plasmid maintenance system antidote protein VapI